MAALHSALTALAPLSYSEVPTPDREARSYLQDIFRKSQVILDSVPAPAAPDSPIPVSLASRQRSSTVTSSTSSGSAISITASSARSDPIDQLNSGLQKEWGKPIKLSTKDNPHNIAVFKLGGKDGKGAWFARRSVHEGMGFRKWKLGLQREFPESLAVQGGPGEGNVRGIGGERRIISRTVDGVGGVEVYHLSAQFPGPTAPRDFVELLITSDGVIEQSSHGRHYLVISKPCQHPDCPPRDGFIRGNYESVEFIREIPKSRPRRSMSAADLRRAASDLPNPPEEDLSSRSAQLNTLPSGRARGHTISFSEPHGGRTEDQNVNNAANDEDESNPVEWIMVTRSDPGGSVPRFMVERGTPGSIVADAGKWLEWAMTKDHGDEDEESVESENKLKSMEAQQTNGHLAGLKEENVAGDEGDGEERDAAKHGSLESSKDVEPFPTIDESPPPPAGVAEQHPPSLVSSAINMARSPLLPYIPKVISDHLPRQPSPLQNSTFNLAITDDEEARGSDSDSDSSLSTTGSFVSVGDRFEDEDDAKSTTDATSTSMKATRNEGEQTSEKHTAEEDKGEGDRPESPELVKIRQRRKTLDMKFQELKQKETEKVLKEKGQQQPASQVGGDATKETTTPATNGNKSSSEPAAAAATPTTTVTNPSTTLDPETAKTVETRLQKAASKHAKEISKQDLKYQQTLTKLSQKRDKESQKQAAQKRKAESKDRELILTRENEELRKQLSESEKGVEALREQLGALQRENTALVAKLGKMDGGGTALWELRKELLMLSTTTTAGEGGGGGKKKKITRSRSNSTATASSSLK